MATVFTRSQIKSWQRLSASERAAIYNGFKVDGPPDGHRPQVQQFNGREQGAAAAAAAATAAAAAATAAAAAAAAVTAAKAAAATAAAAAARAAAAAEAVCRR